MRMTGGRSGLSQSRNGLNDVRHVVDMVDSLISLLIAHESKVNMVPYGGRGRKQFLMHNVDTFRGSRFKVFPNLSPLPFLSLPQMDSHSSPPGISDSLFYHGASFST
jgi:hypothetical protein